MSVTSEIRQQCRERGIPFSRVQDVYRELRANYRADVDADHTPRAAAYALAVGNPNCARYWRFFDRVYPQAWNGGDQTMIPRFDELASDLSLEFPQFATNDPAQSLWDFLHTDYLRMPSAAAIWAEALESSDAGEQSEFDPAAEFAFGANAF